MNGTRRWPAWPALSILAFFAIIQGFSIPAQAGSRVSHEFAAPDSLGHLEPPFPELENLEAQLGFSLRYTRFTGEDMRDTYGGIPVGELNFTARISRYVRFFGSIGYGRNQGNPYLDVSGYDGPDRATVTTVPAQIGLKTNFARSRRMRFYGGIAMEISWIQEELPLMRRGLPTTPTKASGLNTGYAVTLGPEFVLGPSANVVGLEVGWGGSKGSVSTDQRAHNVDLTGLRGRIYYALAL